jgi:TIR domain
MEGLVNSKPRVFISFNTEADQIRAQELRSALEASESFAEVFEYTQHPKGTEWRTATDTKLKNADLFIVLVSNASIDSEEVVLECEVAKTSETVRDRPKIVPVFIKERPALKSYKHRTLQWLLNRTGVIWTEEKTH